jgi:hypothetical protein
MGQCRDAGIVAGNPDFSLAIQECRDHLADLALRRSTHKAPAQPFSFGVCEYEDRITGMQPDLAWAAVSGAVRN